MKRLLALWLVGFLLAAQPLMAVMMVGGGTWSVSSHLFVLSGDLYSDASEGNVSYNAVTPNSSDYTVEVTGTIGATAQWDRAFGVGARMTDASHGYIAVLFGDGGFAILKKNNDTNWYDAVIASASYSISGSTPYTIVLSVSGSTISARLWNGSTPMGSAISATDATYSSAGKAAVMISRSEPRVTHVSAQ